MNDQETNTGADQEPEPTRTRPRPQLQTRDQVAAGSGSEGPDRLIDALGDPEPVLLIGGRRFEVKELSVKDIIAIEKAYGKVDDFFAGLNGSVEKTAFIFWRMMLRSEPDLTFDQAAELIPARALGGLTEQLLAASGVRTAAGNDGPAPATG
jgi:hypothetical protein